MGYFTRQDLSYYYALADAFTIGDGYFCSVLGPTNPNRLYLMSGMVDAIGKYEGPVISNAETPPYTWTTYPARLEQAGVSWKIYQSPDNFDDNALAWFAQFQQAPTSSPLYQKSIAVSGLQAFIDDIRSDSLPSVSWLVGPTLYSEHPGGGAPARGCYLTDRSARPPRRAGPGRTLP